MRVRRRKFIALLGGAGVAWPLGARSQQPAKLPTVGFLGAGTPSSLGQWFAALVQRLRGNGCFEELPRLIDELLRSGVDVMVATGSHEIIAGRRATSTVPIVMLAVADPDRGGFCGLAGA